MPRAKRARTTVCYAESSDSEVNDPPSSPDLPRKKRDPLDRLNPDHAAFRWPVYRTLVETMMGATDRDDRLDPDVSVGGSTAAASAAALKPLVREMLSSRARFAQRFPRTRMLAAAAGLVLMGHQAMTTKMAARADRAEEFSDVNPEAAELALARLEHIDATEHFGWAEEILTTDDYDYQLGLAESFGDDFE